jgi:hypothetical protein
MDGTRDGRRKLSGVYCIYGFTAVQSVGLQMNHIRVGNYFFYRGINQSYQKMIETKVVDLHEIHVPYVKCSSFVL